MTNKKIYIPDKSAIIVLYIFLLTLGLVPFCVAIYAFFITFSHIFESEVEDTIIRLIIAFLMLLPMILLSYKISQYICYTIVLDKDKLYIHEDTNPNKRKIQYYTYAKYIDIRSIEIIWSNRKSNGEKSSVDSITGGRAKIPYLKIITKSNEEKLFMIMFMSKKTIKKLIIELERRINACDNMIQIDDIDLIINSIK